jgi:GT2 family glycosyltransferase
LVQILRGRGFPPASFQRKNASDQCRYQIQYGSTIIGAAPFIKRLVFDEIGFFNEKYPFMEDFPFYVKATQNNIKIFTLGKLVAKYRLHQQSISQGKNSKFSLSYNDYVRDVLLPLSKERGMYLYYWHKRVTNFMQNKIDKFPFNYLILRYIVVGMIDPYRYYIKVNKIFHKLVK